MKKARKCKYAKKSPVKGYVICDKDGSRRLGTKLTCICPRYELSWWQKFKDKLRSKLKS